MANSINTDRIVSLSSIHVNQALPEDEKLFSFIRQTNGNPYRIISGKFVVTSEFDAHSPRLKDVLTRFVALPNSTFLN